MSSSDKFPGVKIDYVRYSQFQPQQKYKLDISGMTMLLHEHRITLGLYQYVYCRITKTHINE